MKLLDQTTNKREHKMNNSIIVVAKHLIEVAAPDCVGVDMGEHMWLITGDYGFCGTTLTRAEALEIANYDAAQNGDTVYIEE